MDGVRTCLVRHLRCWPSYCQRRNASAAASLLPRKIQGLFESDKIEPLKDDQLGRLVSFVQKGRPALIQRSALIKCLDEGRTPRDVAVIASLVLFDSEHNLRHDVTAFELKKYFGALLSMGKSMKMDNCMLQLIERFSLTNKSLVTSVINAVLVQSGNVEPIRHTLLSWARYNRHLHGHADFTNYEQYRYILKTLLFFLREKKLELRALLEALDFISDIEGPLTASQLTSTFMYLFAYNRDFSVAEELWNYKLQKTFPITKSDLTAICKTYCHFQKYQQVQDVYAQFPEAHDDYMQFDYILIAYAKLQDWQSLQNQFNALFGIGELPNINHYGIVMFAVARLGEKDMVEKLYQQLLRRKMIPNLPVLQALLQVYYRTGDANGCFRQFELFNKYGLKPTPSSCSIMLRVYRNLNDVDGALRFLKKMTESKVEVSERHFATIINTCSKTTNYAIAEELFQVMKGYYNIKPTGVSIGALMHVYTESDLPQLALKTFKEYRDSKAPCEKEIAIYNKAIEAYMHMGDTRKSKMMFNEVLQKNLPADAEFYKIMIQNLSLHMKDFETAENVLDQLLEHSALKALPTHFEVLMGAYDKISNREGVLRLYQKMLDHNVPVNSKVLYYLIKASFKLSLKSRENLDDAIKLVDDIMERAANRTLDITFEKLHPSVMAWPMRAAAKYHSPMKAIELMNKYNELFFDKTDSAENKLVVLRSLMVLSAEVHQWDDFQKFYDRYLSKIEYYRNLPSSMVPNRKFRSLLRGVLSYKIKHLVAIDKVTKIPELLKSIVDKRFVIDNEAWNEAIVHLFADSRTIEDGIEAVDKKLIHGFNLVHKYRSIRKADSSNTSTDRTSWFMEKKRQDPSKFQPTLYLKSGTYERISESMDNYLNSLDDIDSKLKYLNSRFKYFMKRYIMHPRSKVHNWTDIESRHAPYFQKLREDKRAVSSNEFPF